MPHAPVQQSAEAVPDGKSTICGELRHQVNEFTRAPLPHLRENPANRGTHFLYHPMRLLAPGISKIHANDAPIFGVNVTRDPALLLQRRQHGGDTSGACSQRRRQLRWRLRPLHGQLPEHELLTMGSTSEFPLHCRTIAPHAGIQFTNCFLLKSHKSTIHFHSLHGRAPQTSQEYLTHRKQFTTRSYSRNAQRTHSKLFEILKAA